MQPARNRQFTQWQRLLHIQLVALLCSALLATAGAAQAPAYRVECSTTGACRADLATYIGWRVFQAQCATCHAADVRGSSFAPDLTLRMGGMTQREFFAALDHGYLAPQSGMAPRGRDPNVAPYYDELWSFLRARISGDLPPGPVAQLAEEPGAPAD